MGEISIDPKFNIHETYKKMRILNPYRNDSPIGAAELVVNGNFENNINGWTSYYNSQDTEISWDNGTIKLVQNDSRMADAYQGVSIEPGKEYEIRIVARTNGIGRGRVYLGSDNTANYRYGIINFYSEVDTEKSINIVAGQIVYIKLRTEGSGNIFNVNSVSLREVI